MVQKPGMMVIGIECRTSNESHAAPHDIPRLWERFYREAVQNKIPNKVSNEVIALYCDYEKDHTRPYSCVIGCPVDSFEQIPPGMVGKMVPASTCALFQTSGPFPQSLVDTWNTIWKSHLKRSYTVDYEVYGEKFLSPLKEVDILIAIEGN